MTRDRFHGDVSVTIDELVVEGLDLPSARRLGTAFREELGSLIEQRGLPAGLRRGADVPALGLDPSRHPETRHPEILGRRLAGRLYERLDGPLGEEDAT